MVKGVDKGYSDAEILSSLYNAYHIQQICNEIIRSIHSK